MKAANDLPRTGNYCAKKNPQDFAAANFSCSLKDLGIFI